MADSNEDPIGEGNQSNHEDGEHSQQASLWEWVVAALSTALVLGTIGFMLYEAITEPDTPPQLTVQVDTIISSPEGYTVVFRAHNRGQTTAAAVTIEGELRADTGSVEKSEVTISYVPAEASRKGGLFFSHNPAHYQLQLRPKGYDRP